VVVPRSPVAAVHASLKRSTPSASPFTTGTSAPAARSAATRSAVASSGTTASSSSKGGVRKTAPRTSPPSSYHPNSIGSGDQRRPVRTLSSTVSAIVCSAGLLVSRSEVRSAYSSKSLDSVQGTTAIVPGRYMP
jgi:hypothetical protein